MSIVQSLSNEFERLHQTALEVLELIPPEKLYWRPYESERFLRVYSCGELLAHIGAIVEYGFNGISRNFWDDPFDWTMPEALASKENIKLYLEEVAAIRREAFSLLKDEDLSKLIYPPSGKPVTIGQLIIKMLTHAVHHRGQVYAYVHLFSEEKLPSIFVTAVSDHQ